MFIELKTKDSIEEPLYEESYGIPVYHAFRKGSLQEAQDAIEEANIFYEGLDTQFYVKKDRLESEILALKKNFGGPAVERIPEEQMPIGWDQLKIYAIKAIDLGSSFFIPSPFVKGAIGLLSSFATHWIAKKAEKKDILRMRKDMEDLKNKVQRKYKKCDVTVEKIDSVIQKLDNLSQSVDERVLG